MLGGLTIVFLPLPPGTDLSVIAASLIGSGDDSTGVELIEIFVFGSDHAVILIRGSGLRWSDTGPTVMFFALQLVSAPQLIGIGEFLEMLWNDIVVLLNQ